MRLEIIIFFLILYMRELRLGGVIYLKSHSLIETCKAVIQTQAV